MFGVFYYRSANPKTLRLLSQFLPVPVEALTAEFAAGATPVDVCARTLRAMMDVGVRHFYISNLPLLGASTTLNRHPRTRRRDGVRLKLPGRLGPAVGGARRLAHCSRRTHENARFHQRPSHPSDAHPLPVRLPDGRLGLWRGGGDHPQPRPAHRVALPRPGRASRPGCWPRAGDHRLRAQRPARQLGQGARAQHGLLNSAALALFAAGWLLGRAGHAAPALPLLLQGLATAAMSPRRGWAACS